MTRIERIDVRLVDLAPAAVRVDAMQSFVKQETVLVDLQTSDGLSGTGYSYTIGTGGRAVVSLITEHLAPALLGQDARPVEALWRHMIDQTRATTTGVITSLAFAAVDTALWDLRGRRTGESLWQMAGGAHPRLPVYDTEGGWLHLPVEDVVDGAKRSAAAGMGGAKIKVGKPSPAEDAERLAAVREAVGPGFEVMVDANQAFTAAEAIRRARTYEPLDIAWFEEPLPADDLRGHQRLAASTCVPVAVGESLYSVQRFGDYLAAGAVGIIQPDVARVGGITPWLKVAHAAEAFNIAVSPHFLMELHVSLAAAVPNGIYVEHIPQLRAVTRSSLVIEDGCATPPDVPGIGIDWDPDTLDDHRVA
ncbi:mandelate racemase/muconate lactonizing enzyme family protein [Streptomyces sp. NPDC050997]|uniref:mandelate racemase/muconate lactonizing enzyme family protein n=1 Tax=Streptomyces sp. NPDC050997 TaxID=3155519 RepID=UPI0034372CAC